MNQKKMETLSSSEPFTLRPSAEYQRAAFVFSGGGSERVRNRLTGLVSDTQTMALVNSGSSTFAFCTSLSDDLQAVKRVPQRVNTGGRVWRPGSRALVLRRLRADVGSDP